MKACCSARRIKTFNHKISQSENERVIKRKKRLNYDRFISLSGGEFSMGTNGKEGFKEDGEGPVRKVKVDPFSIDRYTVTNKEFYDFIQDTGYVTDAEKYGWSFVFHLLISERT